MGEGRGSRRGWRLVLLVAVASTTGAVHARMDTGAAAEAATLRAPEPRLTKLLAQGFAPVVADWYWVQVLQIVGGASHEVSKQAEAIGDPRGVGNPRGFSARDHVELLESGVAGERGGGEVNQLAADAWIKDELAAVDVDRACPAGGEDERLVLGKQHRLHFQQHPGGGRGDKGWVCGMHGVG